MLRIIEQSNHPRIEQGIVDEEATNEGGHKDYPYFYGTPDQIAASMRRFVGEDEQVFNSVPVPWALT